MHRAGIRAAFLALVIGQVSRAAAEPPVFVSCNEPPASVRALGVISELEAFGVAPEAALAVAAMASPADAARSVLRFAKAGDEPEDVKLPGRVLGLAVAPDGKRAYAIVRLTGRKGAVRSVDLVRVDLETARVTSGPTIPATARGLALGFDGTTLLVASQNEIRTFQLPDLASGPLFRALGDNVGVAPIADSSFVLVAQPSRVALADLAAPQGRDGLVLSQEAAAPAPLRGMLASAGDRGPIVLSESGLAWCIESLAPPPAPPPPPVQDSPAETEPAPVVAEPPSAPAQEPPAETERAPAATELPPPVPPAPTPPGPGTVSGVVSGPSVAEVAAIVFLGPDNVLREAARAIPDEKGRFVASALPPGAYRIVAAGKAGRVLICEPPFTTIRVDSNGAVEAPVLKVLRAQ
jgi:hypothetical protein